MAKKNTTSSFEKEIKRVQEIAEMLENDSLPLDTSIQLYEEAMTLLRNCTRQLDEAVSKFNTLKEEE